MPASHGLETSDVSIIVPIGGPAPSWEIAARSLSQLDPPPGEIVAVIDGGDPSHATIASGIGARVVVLHERGGPARARNRGADEAAGEILLFVDSDVEVPADLVSRVSALFAADPELAAVIGSYDDQPGDPSFLSQYRNLLHHFVHQNGREMASTFWAGCGAIRRRVFDQLGGFDTSYGNPSIEDIELGARLCREGHHIRMVKDLQVGHLKHWGLADMCRTDLLRRAVPWTEQMLRDGGLIDDLNVTARARASVVLACLVPLLCAAGWWWPPLFVGAGLAAILTIALNADLLGFYLRRRGPLFALATVPMYWLYLVICGLGFGIGLVRHRAGPGR
jgi:GT2 family glycosyltransferase